MTTEATAAVTAATTPVNTPVAEEAEDDWLSGASACSIENGEDCEACQ